MVSIIIPYVDETEYLAEALASAAGQQGVDTEIILVCNALHFDPTGTAISDTGVSYTLLHEPQRGSAYARNAGLRVARGEWIQYLDVDDLLHPEKIRHQLIHAGAADVVVSPHTYLYLNGKTENSKWLPEDTWSGMLNSGVGSTSSMLWRRQALTETGGWNTAYASHQEYELLFRLAAAGKKILPNDHCETIVRQRKAGSITLGTRAVRAREGIQLRTAMWQYLEDHQQETPERFEAFRQYIFRSLRGLYRQDPEEALRIYGQFFKDTPFIPKDIHVPGYGMLYRLLGFKVTEKLIYWKNRKCLPDC